MKRKCSLEEKLAAIALVEQGMSARSVSDKLHLGHHVLFEWLAAYKERGIQGLIPKGKRPRRLSYEEKCKIIQKLGRPKTGMVRTKRIPKEEYEKENERLRKENERLRLENLLLKKVRALVEEREARNRAIGRKPSKN